MAGSNGTPVRSRLNTAEKRISLQRPVTIITLIVIAVLALVPIVFLVWGTFVEGGRFTVDAFLRAYGQARLSALVYNTLQYAIGATVISTVFGTAIAYLVARTDVAFRRLLFTVSLVPIMIPGLLYTIAWVFLGSSRIGLINTWLEPVLGSEAFDIFSMGGMILVQGLDNAGLAFLLMYASFRSMDPSLEESALMSGASLTQVVTRVTLPANRPALFATVLILFIRNVESFETPAILGLPEGILVFTSRIWNVLQFPPDYGQAGALSMSLLLLVSVGVYYYQRLQRHSQRFATISGKGFRPHVLPLGGARLAASGLALLYASISVALPLSILVFASFQPFFARPSMESLSMVSLDNYRFVLNSTQVLDALKNSMLLAVAAATVTMLLMAIAAWIVVRSRSRAAWLVDNLAFLPLVIPGLVLGVALIFVYTRVPVPVYGTLWILLVAFCTKNMPYGMRAAVSSMVQISRELEESAEMSGASWLQRFLRVVVPLLVPGLTAGWIYIMITSLRELSTALLIYPPGGEVIAVRIWHMYDRGYFTELAAAGVLLIAVMTILVLIAQRMGAKLGAQGEFGV